jgi:protein involved in polysaccharide export with SLBB domain
MHKSFRLGLAAALTLACAGSARAQITGGVSVMPNSDTYLTDLNNVVLFRSAVGGTQAFDGPVDASRYLVGPGDRIEINIWNPVARNFDLTVTPEGTLLIPSFGELSVAGLVLDSARLKILDSLGEQFPASDASATLVQARSVRVHVAGAVAVPGTYVVQASQRVADAITAAGGILPSRGSVRHVELTSAGTTRSVDLWQFYARGDQSQNPYLTGGDFIRVLPREAPVDQMQIAGAVGTPGLIEYRDGDRVSDLVRFADGFAQHADLARITLTRTDYATGRGQTYSIRATTDSAGIQIDDDLPLARGDRVFVAYESTAGRTATVALYGEVQRPGHYAVVEDSTTLSELLTMAGGLTPRASPHELVFLRPSYRNLLAGDTARPLVSTSLDLLLAGDASLDVPLRNRDSIFIPTRSLAVQVIGRVRRPGILAYEPGQTAKAYLERAGGYAANADKGAVRVIRAVSGAVEMPDTEHLPQPGDQIVVPYKPPVSLGRRFRDGLTLVSTLATTYFVLREISK